MVLLCKEADGEADEPFTKVDPVAKLEYIDSVLLKMINTLVDCLLTFYQLEEKVPLRALSRELFVNLITNLVLSKELYFLVFHLTSATLES